MEWLVLIALLLGFGILSRIQTSQHSKRLARAVIELYINFQRSCYSEAEFRDHYLAELSKINFDQPVILTASLTSILEKQAVLQGCSANSRALWSEVRELIQTRPRFWLSHQNIVNSAYQLVRKELLGRLPSEHLLQFVPWNQAIRHQVETKNLLDSQTNSLRRELELLFLYSDVICESQKVFNSVGLLGPGRPPIPKELNGI